VRIDKERNKVTYQAALRLLPDGCFVQIEGSAYLVLRDALLLRTPQAYERRDAAMFGSPPRLNQGASVHHYLSLLMPTSLMENSGYPRDATKCTVD
jgi:hypothetical protein